MTTRQRVKSFIKILYSVLITNILLYGGYYVFSVNQELWQFIGELSWSALIVLLLSAMILLLGMNGFYGWLCQRNLGWLKWCLWPRNINFIALDYVFLRVPFLVGLYLNLPFLAFFEEFIFRDGFGLYPTRTLGQVLWRSAVFGLAHVIGGCRIRECIAIMLGGVGFSIVYIYFGAQGLFAATLMHLTCNTLELTYRLGQWAYTKKNPFNE